MDIPSFHVHQVLSDKHVAPLYHADSGSTTCEYLLPRSFLSLEIVA